MNEDLSGVGNTRELEGPVQVDSPAHTPRSVGTATTCEAARAIATMYTNSGPLGRLPDPNPKDESLWLDALDALERQIEQNELEQPPPFSDDDDSSGDESGDNDSHSDSSILCSDDANPSIFPFLSLPGELRNMVYNYYLFDYQLDDTPSRHPGRDVPVRTHTKYINVFHVFRTGPRDVDGQQHQEPEVDEPELDMTRQLTSPLFQTSRILRREALSLFLNFTCFVFDAITDLHIFLVRLGPRGRSRLRHIHLLDGFMISGWNTDSNVETIELLASCTHLSSLALVVDEWSVCEVWDKFSLAGSQYPTADIVFPTVEEILAQPEYVALRKIRVKGEVLLGHWNPDSSTPNIIKMGRLMDEAGERVISAIKGEID